MERANRKSFTGRRFGRLKVLEYMGVQKDNAGMPRAHWLCSCACGRELQVSSTDLVRKRKQSCGECGSLRLSDLSGKRFKRWTVLEYVGDRYWKCRCKCGTVRNVHGESLKAGTSLSCGCHRSEQSAKNMRNLRKQMKVEGRGPRTTHGMAYSAEHRAWAKAKSRCHCPTDAAHENYGGRGLTMHPQWRESFEAFFAAIGPRPSAEHSLDRINNERGYEPGNVRWATRIEQAANTRRKRLENFSKAELRAELKRRRNG
jgi:hypothetical protein